MKIKEILNIDLSEDIKNVIDIENIAEEEIKEEIENYIVTDGLAKQFNNFVSIYLTDILETGVWISGFYGSGKSYFGKILGYLLSNKPIIGTPARDRILQRFTGVTDEALIKNTLSGLSSVKSRVIFLDIAKQDTSKGLAYTLFRNFLKSLGLPENEHGYLLFNLMINENQIDIENFIYIQMKREKTFKNIRFWRTKTGGEVDFVAESKEGIIGIESKFTSFTKPLFPRSLRHFIRDYSPKNNFILTADYLHRIEEENLIFLPVYWSFLLGNMSTLEKS